MARQLGAKNIKSATITTNSQNSTQVVRSELDDRQISTAGLMLRGSSATHSYFLHGWRDAGNNSRSSTFWQYKVLPALLHRPQ